MKKIRNLLLIVLLSLYLAVQVSAVEDEVISTGTCGDGIYTLTHSADDDLYTLTVSKRDGETGRISLVNVHTSPDRIIIEYGVTGMADLAFANCCWNTKSIDIAGSVEKISTKAFLECGELTELILNEGLMIIDDFSFQGSAKLTSVVFPSTLHWIGRGAFLDSALTEITFQGAPPTIGNYAFTGTTDENGEPLPLTVYYPDDGSWTLRNMKHLTRPTTYIPFTLDDQGNRVPDPSRAYTAINNGTFEEGGSWYIDDDAILHIEGAADITTIDPLLDERWSYIEGLVVEPGVNTFYHDFIGYSNLKAITFSDDLKIGPRFQYCDYLDTVDLGEGLTVIREKNFYHCYSISYVEIPASVTDIHDAAFDHCRMLLRFTFHGDRPTFHFEDPNMPNILNRRRENWESWRDQMLGGSIEVFYPSGNPTWTEDLDQLVLGTTTEYVPVTFSADGKLDGDYDSVVTAYGIVDYWIRPEPTTGGNGIARTLYANGYAIAEIVNEEVAEIYGYSFGSLTSNYSGKEWMNVKHIQIGEGIVSLRGLGLSKEITHEVTCSFPSTLTEIGAGAFSGLQCIYSLDLNNVTQIGEEAFYGCTSLESVKLSDELTEVAQSTFEDSGLVEITIPDSVTSIGDNAFFNCQQLEQIDLGNHLKSIGYGAFQKCLALENVEFSDSLEWIDEGAFYECTSLKEIKFSEGLISIGEAAFFGCSSLEEVVIPDSVTTLNGGDLLGTIGLGAFDRCINLKSITIGKGVELIPWGFLGSDVLETLIIPDGVIKIDAYAFCSCPSLTYVEIPDSVEYIGGSAFVGNFSMTNIVFKGDPPNEMDDMMGICGDYITASFYPKDAPGWGDAYTGTAAKIPYTLDAAGNIIPEAPEESQVQEAMERFRSGEYFSYFRDLSAGKAYPNNYRYFINGNFHEGKGSEAFAFELSDACFGFLPISDHRDVVYGNLQIGDLLYMGDQVWVIGDITAEGVKVHGAENEVIVYGKALTKAQVEAANSYRTRYGVSPGNGVVNPNNDLEAAPIPEGVPTEAEVYNRIIALKEDYPEGMPWTEKNMYTFNVEPLIEESVSLNPDGHGCSAFGYLASDTAFGELPAHYITYDKEYYDSIMVGDNLLGFNHQMVVLEVYENCLIVAEGNYDKMMHWGRILTREEVEEYYDVFTRYPEGTVAPKRDNYELPEEPEDTVPPTTEPNRPEVPKVNIVYKQDKLYVFVSPYWGVEELYCQLDYGAGSWDTLKMNPVEGKPNVWVVENLPEDITDICPIFYIENCPVAFLGYDVSNAGNNNMFLAYSDSSQWCTYDSNVKYEEIIPGDDDGDSVTEPEETVPPTTEPEETEPTEPSKPEETEPNEPEVTNPTEPEETEPTKPTEPEETEPTKPTEPEETEPTEPPCEHKWSQWKVTSPTSKKEGLRTRECKNCGEKEREVLSKLSGTFQDVPETQYYALPVDWAVQKGITTGVSAQSFAPDAECTRGQIVTFLWRSAGEPNPASSQNPFKDVKSTDYFYKAVLWAVEQGITTGVGEGQFAPNASCTRAQVATFLWRAQGKPTSAGKNPFTDVKQGEYFYEAVIWAVENGVSTGISASTFAPNATCTRGQIVTFLYRAIA